MSQFEFKIHFRWFIFILNSGLMVWWTRHTSQQQESEPATTLGKCFFHSFTFFDYITLGRSREGFSVLWNDDSCLIAALELVAGGVSDDDDESLLFSHIRELTRINWKLPGLLSLKLMIAGQWILYPNEQRTFTRAHTSELETVLSLWAEHGMESESSESPKWHTEGVIKRFKWVRGERERWQKKKTKSIFWYIWKTLIILHGKKREKGADIERSREGKTKNQ